MCAMSIESAAVAEHNILRAVQHQDASEHYRARLWDQRHAIAALVRHHLRLSSSDSCTVLDTEEWIQGGFNVCIIVHVECRRKSQKLVFRCPLPHKLAEQQYPGTVDEKVRSEAATYIWAQEYCTDIRIPDLHAFGLNDGSHFTHIDHRPLHVRLCRVFWRWAFRLLRLPLLSSYTVNQSTAAFNSAYMLLEYIGPEVGEMLSCTWSTHWNDTERRHRLYRGMSRIMLSLARIPQTRLGSFQFEPQNGTIALTNRPLTCTQMLFENGGTPRTIQPNQTYPSTDSFVADMLTLHDNFLLHEAHAVRCSEDARERFTIRTLLRAVAHHFILPQNRMGPFFLQLTDFHQSNIFVDEQWNVTCLIDLEWICALPLEMLSVPYWLTDCSIDDITGDEYATFDAARREFLTTMDQVGQEMRIRDIHNITGTMRSAWESKGVWFWASLRSVNAWLFVFEDHILPKYSDDPNFVTSNQDVSHVWKPDLAEVIDAKVEDERIYQAELKALLASPST